MRSTATSGSSRAKGRARAPRWLTARRELRAGIDLQDDGFRLTAAHIEARGMSSDMPDLKLHPVHLISDQLSAYEAGVSDYLEALALKLPRYAMRGGIASSVAMPPSAQSLRCVSSSQLADAEHSIADELGGEIQSRVWPVGSQKSMICGVRRDVAEAVISILHDSGYRCDSILPRSIALARTLFSTAPSPHSNVTILDWERRRSLVTMIHDGAVRLCREFVISDPTHSDNALQGDGLSAAPSAQDRLTQMASEIADELMQTLQHASRMNSRIVLGPILVCGPMVALPRAFDALRAAIDQLFEGEVEPWRLAWDARAGSLEAPSSDLTNAVAVSLAVGGCRRAQDSVYVGATP